MRRAALALLLALVVLVALVVLGAGCDAGFEQPGRVLDLRVLGVGAEPPEVVADFDPRQPALPVLPPVALTALVADPGDDRRLGWSLRACPPTRSLRCDDPAASIVPIAGGVADDPESAAGFAVAGDLVPTPPLLEESVRADDLLGFGGIGVQVELRVAAEGEDLDLGVHAAKTVVYAARLPAERVANANPAIAGIDADVDPALPELQPLVGTRCDDPAAAPVTVAAGQELRLEPVEPEGIRETYVLPAFDGTVKTFTEYMRYSWFATAGGLSHEHSGGPTDFFGNVPPTHVYWTAPPAERLPEIEGGLVDLWLVQRDERGGTAWTQRCFRVTAP